jgi:hypothetical protein
MVVLLIGIMSVVRIFPWGFLSVRNAENMTFAGRLAQFEIERWKNNAQNLPDGVLPIDNTPDANILWDQYPGPLIKQEPGNDNATTFRRIIGETTRIPFGGWANTVAMGGSRYLLAFAPIADPTKVAVRGGNLSRRLLDSDDKMNMPAWRDLRSSQYAIDYEAHKICFPEAGESRMYYLNLSWWEIGPNGQVLRTATDIPIDVPAHTREWIDILDKATAIDGANFISIESYSDTASRGFRQLQPGETFSSDPYEYVLADTVMGIILFNPGGYLQKEFGKCLEARIDYDILDLQIIHEDKRIPAPVGTDDPRCRVRLTLPRIKQIGESVEIDGSIYQGMQLTSDPDKRLEILAVDLETTLPFEIPGGTGGWIEYKDGIINLPPKADLIDPFNNEVVDHDIPLEGRNIRFFYKAEGDWSVQFMKAFSQYERANDQSALIYNTYKIQQDSEKIWFAACNGNCTISVDYEYTDNGEPRKVVGECHKTSDVLMANPFGDTSPTGLIEYTYIDLKHIPDRIYAVRGASVKARVIWRESERWRNVDLDSILTRKQAE